MLKYIIAVPRLTGEGPFKLVKWYVTVGQNVSKGDKLCEIASGKANKEVYSEYSGTITSLLVEEHGRVNPGDKLVEIEGEEGQEIVEKDNKQVKKGFKGGYFDIKLKKDKKELECDIAILGGGPGGYVAAIRGSQKGKKVILIEKDKLGGTCLNRGCIPTKAFVRSVEVLEELRNGKKYGLGDFEAQYSFAKITERKDKVVNQLLKGIQHLMDSNNITVVYGTGRLKDRNTIEVDGKEFDAVVKAEHIIIATGSRPAKLPIPGAESEDVIDSTQILNMKDLPGSMVIVGGGVIGMEFAFIMNSLGVKVFVVEMMPYILPLVDREISEEIKDIALEKGIKIYTSSKVVKIDKIEGGSNLVVVENNGNTINLAGQKVFISIGRAFNAEGIGLEEAGIEFEGKAIKVDDTLKTSVDNIYAVGDINGRYMLAHVASAEGIVAVDNILRERRKMDYTSVPSAIFTNPEIAGVGLTEQEARKKGYKIKVGRFPYCASGKALAMGEEKGFVKVIADGNGKILGGWIIGHSASDLIPQIALAINKGLTVEDIAGTIYAHPTISECVQEACHDVMGQSIHMP